MGRKVEGGEVDRSGEVEKGEEEAGEVEGKRRGEGLNVAQDAGLVLGRSRDSSLPPRTKGEGSF